MTEFSDEAAITPNNAVRALIAKRAELCGRVEHLQAQLKDLVKLVDHLDASIRILDPDIDLRDVGFKPVPPRSVAPKGEVQRIILQTLRTAEMPMRTTEIADHLLAQRGLEAADGNFKRTMVKRAGACLRSLKKRGIVENIPGTSQVHSWQLVRRAKKRMKP